MNYPMIYTWAIEQPWSWMLHSDLVRYLRPGSAFLKTFFIKKPTSKRRGLKITVSIHGRGIALVCARMWAAENDFDKTKRDSVYFIGSPIKSKIKNSMFPVMPATPCTLGKYALKRTASLLFKKPYATGTEGSSNKRSSI